MATSIGSTDDVVQFLTIIETQGYLNDNTAQARRTACAKLFSVLDEGQRTVEYVRDNIESIKTRFQNLNREIRGTTIEEYGRRVVLAIADFERWTTDRAGWERDAGSRGVKDTKSSASDGEKKQRPPRAEKSNNTDSTASAAAAPDPDSRTVSFPLRPAFEVTVKLPRDGITMAELRRIAWFLLPYATDFDPSESPRAQFPMLEPREGRMNG